MSGTGRRPGTSAREAAARLPDEQTDPDAGDDVLLDSDDTIEDAGLDLDPEEVEA